MIEAFNIATYSIYTLIWNISLSFPGFLLSMVVHQPFFLFLRPIFVYCSVQIYVPGELTLIAGRIGSPPVIQATGSLEMRYGLRRKGHTSWRADFKNRTKALLVNLKNCKIQKSKLIFKKSKKSKHFNKKSPVMLTLPHAYYCQLSHQRIL